MEAYVYMEAHINAVEPVTDFTNKWCLNIGMNEVEAARFALALDELLTNMILFAYPDKRGYVDIWYRYELPQLEIIIEESGEPFDPALHPYSREKALLSNDFTGAGLEIVRYCTDHFLFLNRGKEGKEFRLAKSLQARSLFDYSESLIQDDVREDLKDYRLLPATKQDAEDIAKLIYRSYNYSYSKEDLYFPKQNELAYETRKKFGTIVRTKSGLAVGYFAVIRMPDSAVGEVGEAVVSPLHRRKGLMKKMMNRLVEMSKHEGLMGLYGMAITVHNISQKVNRAFGFHSTALMLAMARGVKYQKLEEHYPQPVSLIADFLPLYREREPEVYLPPRYEDLILKIYAQLGTLPCLMNSSQTEDDERTDAELKINYQNNIAMIVIRTLGYDSIRAINSILLSLKEIRLNAVYIDLPLQQRPTKGFTDWLHEVGFIFSGLLPLYHDDRDYLRVQQIRCPIDFSIIHTLTAMAGEIKECIRKEYNELEKNQSEPEYSTER